mgnify:CR=1 FL=1
MTYPENWEDWEFGQEAQAVSDPDVTPAALHLVLRIFLGYRKADYRGAALALLRANPAWELLCVEDPTLIESYQRCLGFSK